MHDDERQIREMVALWLSASRAGDVATVLSLVTEDVVFLQPGRPPMRKDEFAAAQRGFAAPDAPHIEADSEIQEIQLAGDWAFMWTRLRVAITPPAGATMERAGHTLTVLRREQGRWRIARDANLLAAVPRN